VHPASGPQIVKGRSMKRRTILVLAMLGTTAGCGGGSSAPVGTGILTGNWQMTLQKSDSTLKPKTQSGFLLQQNDTVTGNVSLRATSCSGIGGVTGQVSGSTVSLSVAPTGLLVNLSGTIGSDQASMSGSYAILSQGCSGAGLAPETGTWTANLLKPLNGGFQGTFTSNRVGDLQVTGKVSQSQNGGSSSAPLAGNIAVAGYCFASASLYGSISGTSVVLSMLDPDGMQIGQVIATSSLDSKSLTGTYRVLQQTGKPPCGSGDAGTVTLSF
jgi:hypothetical protein